VKKALQSRWNVEVRREETIGPKIGQELRVAAVEAVLFAMVLMLIYIWIRFQFRFGVAATLAILHDVLVTLGACSIANHEISLVLIAAFLTIVGYSINDKIVVFDRIRENLRVPSRRLYAELLNDSINQTLSRTLITGGSTILVLLILFFFGGEVLRGFAFALVVGIVVGTYSSICFAAPLLVEWENRRPRKAK
jgi:preprotein translocase subunit SecF